MLLIPSDISKAFIFSFLLRHVHFLFGIPLSLQVIIFNPTILPCFPKSLFLFDCSVYLVTPPPCHFVSARFLCPAIFPSLFKSRKGGSYWRSEHLDPSHRWDYVYLYIYLQRWCVFAKTYLTMLNCYLKYLKYCTSQYISRRTSFKNVLEKLVNVLEKWVILPNCPWIVLDFFC